MKDDLCVWHQRYDLCTSYNVCVYEHRSVYKSENCIHISLVYCIYYVQ